MQSIIINKGQESEFDTASVGMYLLGDVKIDRAKRKETRFHVPGRNGSIDASLVPQRVPVFEDRNANWTLKRFGGDRGDLAMAPIRSHMEMLFDGKTVTVHFPWSTGYYFRGVLSFGDFDGEDKGIIRFNAVFEPYRYKDELTTITKNDLTTTPQTITLRNIGRAVVPTVTTRQKTSVVFGTETIIYNENDHDMYTEKNSKLLLPSGGGISAAGSGGWYSESEISVSVADDSETGGHYIEIAYQEAIL